MKEKKLRRSFLVGSGAALPQRVLARPCRAACALHLGEWVKSGTLVIIPHEELHYVPFQVFQDPSDGRFLIEKVRISYAPSATVLSRLKPGRGLAGSSMLAVAGPGLVEAEAEVKAIARLYPAGRVTLLVGDAATEEGVTRRVASQGVLHLAAHGVFDPVNPLLSSIELRSSSGAEPRSESASSSAGANWRRWL